MSVTASPGEIRFEFGKNWQSFLTLLNDERIRSAEESLTTALGPLAGLTFLDIGSGSGLFSLAARNLGARVHSFDFDPSSVWCTTELRRRYHPDDPDWRVEQGSVLDPGYMESLDTFDVVYAWGVLHHTGAMWRAIELTCQRVSLNGRLMLALYNDQGRTSRHWRTIKRLYNRLPGYARPVLVALVLARYLPRATVGDITRRENPLARYRGAQERGMSVWHDWRDWIGGYPYEVAAAGEVFGFLRKRGFEMTLMESCIDWGNNEFVAVRREGLSS